MEAPPATTAPVAPPAAPPAPPAAAAAAKPKPAEPAPAPGPPAALPPGAAARDSAVWNLPIRTYLDQTIVPTGVEIEVQAPFESWSLVVSHWLIATQVPIMLDGMAELVKVRPEDPILWMSEYLRDNNPNTNADAAARAAKRRRLDEEARAAEAAKPAA